MNIKNLCCLIVVCLFFSCNDSDSADAILKKMSADKTIDATEIKQLEAKPRKFNAILTNGKVDNAKLQKELTKLRLSIPTTTAITTEFKKPVYNVFLENSGSMDGYVKGRTDFESSIYNFLSDVNTNDKVTDSLHLFYINSKKIDLTSDSETRFFAQKMRFFYDVVVSEKKEKNQKLYSVNRTGYIKISDRSNILESDLKSLLSLSEFIKK